MFRIFRLASYAARSGGGKPPQDTGWAGQVIFLVIVAYLIVTASLPIPVIIIGLMAVIALIIAVATVVKRSKRSEARPSLDVTMKRYAQPARPGSLQEQLAKWEDDGRHK